MTTFIHNTDKFFAFSDAPITSCELKNQFLHLEFEFVFCWLNNNNKPAIYSSEGLPKLIIQLKDIISWTRWDDKNNYRNDFENQLSSLIEEEFLDFSYKNNIGKIIFTGGEFEFEFIDFQIIVSPTNLFFYRDLTTKECESYPISELPKTNLPVSFFNFNNQ